MHRRTLLKAVAASAAGAATISAESAHALESVRRAGEPFKLKYAPHFGMFRHHGGQGPMGQLQFIADEGFRALEDNGMAGKPAGLQTKIGKEMERLGLEMGVFVAQADFGRVTFASDDDAMREHIASDMRKAVEVAKRVNARWCTVVPGKYDPGLEWDYQTANVIDNLRRAAEICEPSGLVMVIEALNPWRDHPGLFLTKIPQAYMICRAVGSPSCKVLDDLYHQQISEGNLIPNMDLAWDEIAYFQIGDNPGRKEPTTGEINYRNIFRHIHGKGFQGILGMEHGNSLPGKEGERALIDAYRASDAFEG